MATVQDATQFWMPSPSRSQAFNLTAPTTDQPQMTSFPSRHLPNMTQLTTNHPSSMINYSYAIPVPPHNTNQTMNMNTGHPTLNPIYPVHVNRSPKNNPKPTPKKRKSKIILSPRYLITNVHHPLMSSNDPAISTCHPPMNSTHPNPIPLHPSPTSRRSSPHRLPASAPRLSQVDPIAAALSRPKGPPPEYATIDPRKLRTRHLRPIFFRKGAKEKPLRYLYVNFY